VLDNFFGGNTTKTKIPIKYYGRWSATNDLCCIFP
jgi:hypothetical protein